MRIPSPFQPSTQQERLQEVCTATTNCEAILCWIAWCLVALCAQYMLGDRAKATSLAALAGGGKVEGLRKWPEHGCWRWVFHAGSVVSKVISGADFAAQHSTSHTRQSSNAGYSGPWWEVGCAGCGFFFAATLCRVSFVTSFFFFSLRCNQKVTWGVMWMLWWHLSALLRCGQVHRTGAIWGSVF